MFRVAQVICTAFKSAMKAIALVIHVNHKVDQSTNEVCREVNIVIVSQWSSGEKLDVQLSLQVPPVFLPSNKSLIKRLLPSNQSLYGAKWSLYDTT